MESHEISEFDTEQDVLQPKPVRLSLHVIQKRNIKDAEKLTQNQIVEALNQITHLRLDRENIGEIDGLELLGDRVTNLYLQRNRITGIQNLECLKNLAFLTLAGNQISQVQGLLHFSKLIFLDLSENCIDDYDLDEFPQSLIILNLKENPCTSLPNHRRHLIKHVEKLKQLDEVEITKEEKREVGYEVSSDDEEEEEEEDIGTGNSRIPSLSKENLQGYTTKLLRRSQNRLEQDLHSHLRHTTELDVIRENCNLPESVRNYTPRPPHKSSNLAGASS